MNEKKVRMNAPLHKPKGVFSYQMGHMRVYSSNFITAIIIQKLEFFSGAFAIT